MKKIVFLMTGVLGALCLQAQIYLKPVITSESSPGACDASITVIPYGGTPPYSIEWYGEGTWANSTGFTAENLCPGESIRITVTDANCFPLETYVRITSDPLDQITLDTILITYPTPGNNDGSVQVFFLNVPSGAPASWGDSGSGGTTTQTLFTGLDEDFYAYQVGGAGNFFRVAIPLFGGTITPCETFRTEVYTTPVSTYLERNSECSYVAPPDSIPYDTVSISCNGSVISHSFGSPSDVYYTSIYFHPDGGASGGLVIDSLQVTDSLRCRGVFSVNVSSNSIYYTLNTVFVQDSLDLTYYWNFPDTLPDNTDTVVMDALNVPAINYQVSIDTAFIYSINHIAVDQYEVVTAFIQDSDTFLVYTTEFLDTSYNYLLDISTFEGDSLLCNVNNAYRHIIYFEWPVIEEPCDSVLICHIPPGNPGNAHTILVACDEVQDHLDHGDALGDCAEQRRALITIPKKNLTLYPNPFGEQFTISSSVSIEHVEIFSIDGKSLMTIAVNSSYSTLNTQGLPPSVYLVKITFDDGSSEMKRMMKTIK